MRMIPVVRASVSSHLHSRKNLLSSSGFIMVIELSGVQFGLKSYAWFRNCARLRFEITSMISDQNCTTRSSITTLLHPFWNHSFFFFWNLYWSTKLVCKEQNPKRVYMYMPTKQNDRCSLQKLIGAQRKQESTSFMPMFKQLWSLVTAKIVFFKV